MSSVWRFTGPPENWVTALGIKKWALNENNKNLWENRFESGDIVFFHSTQESGYDNKAISSVIGYGFIGQHMSIKSDLWWVQEVVDKENKWPFVVPLEQITTFSNIETIDFSTPIHEKSSATVLHDIKTLLKNAVHLRDLEKEAKLIDPGVGKFPVNGSASRILSQVYEDILLRNDHTVFEKKKKLKERVAKNRSDEEIRKRAKMSRGEPVRRIIASAVYDRNADVIEAAKRRAGGKCQLCVKEAPFDKKNGEPYLETHHIVWLSEGGHDVIENTVALCPNCHRKMHSLNLKEDIEILKTNNLDF